jgi:signal transduction histidine kinase
MDETPRAPLVKRVPPGAWMALIWCAAIAYTLGPPPRGLQVLNGPRLVAGGGAFSSVGWPLLAIMGGVMVLSACLLRRRPLLALALLLTGSVAAAVAPDSAHIVFLPFLPVGIAVCFIAATRPRWISVAAAVVALGVLVGRSAMRVPPGAHANPSTPAPGQVIALTIIIAWLIGYAIRQNRVYAGKLHAQAEAQAVTAERLRIAREVHDMVAHSIGIIAIQAGVGSRVIDTQPAEARNALSAIEATSRETLAGLRRMLGALRRAEPGPVSGPAPLDPAPGLADVGRLTATTTGAGLRVDVQWRGQRRPLPADIDLSAFRIIQEAVTNVARHASARQCKVSIDCRDEELRIEVVDDGHGCAAQGTGYGIAGMRERAALLRGHFTAGPRPEGGFRVTARLPVPAAAPAGAR